MTDYVLVPMQLDAMVLSEKASVMTPFLRSKMDYSKLAKFDTAEPDPFEGASIKQPDPGIYLMWTLPKALRTSLPQGEGGSSVPAEDGTTNFPFAPNRFLVARVRNDASPETAITAWILESDYMSSSDASSPYVNPDPTTLDANGAPKSTKIGRCRALTTVESLLPAGSSFLTTAGPGNATFSVYSPGIENVFAFTDPLTGIDAAQFSYYVIGWYANPTDDPLQQSTWALNSDDPSNYLNSLFDWVVYANNSELIPKNMLVHTLVSGVPWNRFDDSSIPDTYPQDIPNTVKVAFGNTSEEAFEALGAYTAEANAQANADLLTAFQYNTLDTYDKPASASKLDIEYRQHWYGSSSGGTVWSIVPQEPDQSTALPAPEPEPISLEQKTALDSLNATQREYDRQERILQSMQYVLYTLWWKANWQRKNPFKMPVSDNFQDWLATQLPLQVNGDDNYSTWYIDQVRQQQTMVATAAEACKTAQTAVETLLVADKQWLQATSMPAYYYANDPVLLVSGLGRATNFDPTGSLLCRCIQQTVCSLTVEGVTYGITDAAQVNISSDIPVLNDPYGLLPNGVQALNIENFFLSPALFAQNILKDPNKTDEVEAAIAALPAPAADTRFPPPEFARPIWTQPWVPLLLDWEITLFKDPAYQCDVGAPTAQFNRQYWVFDGNDYVWNDPTPSDDTDYNQVDSEQMQLQGRTFVGPYVPTTTANQINTLAQSLYGNSANRADALETSKQSAQEAQAMDVLSQRLSGLMAQMVERNYQSNVAPSGEIATALGTTYQGYSNPWPNDHASYEPAVWDFAPMRGTFFVINRLMVIDSFGRTVDLMQSNYSTYPHTEGTVAEYYFYPIADEDLQTSTTEEPEPNKLPSKDPTTRMLKLSPRLIQDAQLAFNLTANDASNENIETSASNPVCGWLVPNHLNESLAVYAEDGQSWGEIYLSLQSDGVYLPMWQPNPDPLPGVTAPQSVAEIPNIYIKAMLTPLMKPEDQGKSLRDFIQAIDETLWTIDPQGDKKDAELSVLVGTPLAVVRASLALKLRGLAYVNQDWWNTFEVSSANSASRPPKTEPAPLAEVTGGIFDYPWSIRLGSRDLTDDGLIGYYLENASQPEQTYDTFNCIVTPDTVRSTYLKAIAPGNFIDLKFTDDTTPDPDPQQQQMSYVTMLIDPRGSCHAFTGILPVYDKLIPTTFTEPALKTIAYLFRAGPIITPPEEALVPQPAEDQGKWSWFDQTSNTNIPLSTKITEVRFPKPNPLLKQGWLKFRPDINDSQTEDNA